MFMAVNKSFRQILREKMTKNGDFSEGNWTKFTLKTASPAPISPLALEDLLLGKIDISNRRGHFSPRESWFSLYKREYEKFLTEEIRVEIPLEKRNWSEAQHKALQALIGFGAEDLSEFSSDSEIKKAFRQLAKRYHPDMLRDQPESIIKEKSQQFMLIHKSYRELIGSCGT